MYGLVVNISQLLTLGLSKYIFSSAFSSLQLRARGRFSDRLFAHPSIRKNFTFEKILTANS